MNQKLLDYIKTARTSGMTDGKIKEELLGVGWKLPDIEESLRDSNTQEIKSVKVERSSHSFKTVVFIIWAILFAAFGFFVLDKIFNWGIMSQKKEAVVRTQTQEQNTASPSSTVPSIVQEDGENSTSTKLVSIPEDYKLIEAQFSPDAKKSLCIVESNGQKFILIDNLRSAGYDSISSCKFSGTGGNFFCIAKKSNKFFVISGEQESKPYDSLIKNPIFSPNGKKVAYFAKSGKSVFLVLGGEESQINFQSIGESVFSFDGSHFAYSASVSTTASVTSTAGTTTVVVPAKAAGKLVVLDGQDKALYQDVFGIVFSPDGGHLAYIATKDDKKILVLDDKEIDAGGEVYVGPQFSDDGQKISYGVVMNNEVWWKTEAVE